ncbi:MAG: hypothetical protein ABW252_22005 [Polyangiales bacterium]
MEWFRAGGVAMWFLTAVGLLALIGGGRFAARPDPALLPRVACLTRALAWGMVAGVASDLAAVGYHIARTPEWAHDPDLAVIAMQGIAESLMPAVLGAAISSVVALLLATGHARLHAHGGVP